ncbi:MAG TPA: hypothetical protein VLE47_01845 [Candidatus Saccharimonadales bacterium]|nr:hypothetical protein [Candidatus Saccharimonadales bacterium]
MNSTLLIWVKTIIVGLLLWIGFFSVWFTNDIYNKDNFTQTLTSVLKDEEVRQAVADQMVANFSDKFPILGKVLGPTLNKTFVGVLGSDLFDKVYSKLASGTYDQLTSTRPKAVVINVGDATNFLSPLLEKAAPELSQKLSELPSEVVIIKAGQIPNIAAAASFITTFGRGALVLGIVLLAYFFFQAKSFVLRKEFSQKLGIVIAVSSATVYLTLGAAKTYAISQANTPAGETIIKKLYEVFTVDLANFAALFVVVGIGVLVISSIIKQKAKA